MSKVIAVMDKPKNCEECDLYVCYRQYAGDKGDCFCGMTKQDTPSNGRPSWCPLKPMPKKKDTKYNPARNPYTTEGYNACIDEILKGSEEP